MAEKKPDRHARRTCKTLILTLSILAGIELHGQTGALGIDCQFTGGCESTRGTPVQQVDPSGGKVRYSMFHVILQRPWRILKLIEPCTGAVNDADSKRPVRG